MTDDQLTDKDKWTIEIGVVKEYWNQAYEELAEKSKSHIAMPTMNAFGVLASLQMDEINRTGMIAMQEGMPPHEAVECIRAELKRLVLIVFYAGHMMGKNGFPIEEIPCGDHPHGD